MTLALLGATHRWPGSTKSAKWAWFPLCTSIRASNEAYFEGVSKTKMYVNRRKQVIETFKLAEVEHEA